VIAQAEEKGLTSDEHFSVDGTMIEAWASMKSLGVDPPLSLESMSYARVGGCI
jgi:hypothetical protein